MLAFVLILFLWAAAPAQTARQADSLYRVDIYEHYLSGDKEAVLQRHRDLIDYHRNSGDERLFFNAYASLFERLQEYGRSQETVDLLEEMTREAVGSRRGKAVTEFCFGQYYLSTRNPQEAEGHYRLAMQELSALEEWPRAIRAGFNLQAVAMNLNRLDEGLAMNDTTAALVQLLEKRNGKPHIPNRYRQTRYRFVLLQRLGRLKEARPLKDSLLSYAAILNDPSQDGVIYTALAQYEQLTGNKEEAYAMLDTLIQRSKRSGNWTTTARYRLSLADFQQDNKDYEQAVVNYRLYAAESDSAQVQHTNEQINELTKRFELRQLKQENKAARQRNTALTAVVGFLVALLAAILLYARALRRKNRALFQAHLESIHAEEQAEQVLVEESATKDMSAEEKLYAGLLSLMQQEELFKDPDLSRDTLAARLGTNRTYLADAVKSCAGQTLGDFVNHLRLRWAAEALSQESVLSVSAVGEDAGFASRSTFYRLFQQHYGMSPSAFRTAARG